MARSGVTSSAMRLESPEAKISGIIDRANKVAEIAASYADDVDLNGRFPHEAFENLKKERLLGIFIPEELGGEGSSVGQTAEVCFILGRACSATAMIYAMHQMAVAALVDYGQGNAWQEAMLRRIAKDQLLLASSTTEGVRGGDLRSSEAPIQFDGNQITLERAATCISYGEFADCIVTTARRSPEATANQQSLLVLPKETYELEKRNSWNTLGMRGTCSVGFLLKANGVADQILSEGFDRINARCTMPVAHLGWAAAWTGVAAAALEKARAFTMSAIRRSNGKTPPGASQLARAVAALETLRSCVVAAVSRYEEARKNPAILDSIEFQSSMNLLKVEASEQALSIALAAMRICGLSGYRNDSDFSVGRHVRDLLSAPVMINNDRILSNMSSLSLLRESPSQLGI